MLSSARRPWTTGPRSIAGRAPLRHTGYQIFSSLKLTIQVLHHFSESVIGDPSFDTYRLERIVRRQLPHDLRIVPGQLTFFDARS
jgi:hypothetical protein